MEGFHDYREVEKIVPHKTPNQERYSSSDFAKLIVAGETYYSKLHTPNGIYKDVTEDRWYWEMEGPDSNDIPVTGSFIDGKYEVVENAGGGESKLLTVMDVIQ